jgi:hypothetical protein
MRKSQKVTLIFLLLIEYVQIGLKKHFITSQHSPHHIQCRCVSASLMPGFHEKKTPLTDCVATYALPLLSHRPY